MRKEWVMVERPRTEEPFRPRWWDKPEPPTPLSGGWFTGNIAEQRARREQERADRQREQERLDAWRLDAHVEWEREKAEAAVRLAAQRRATFQLVRQEHACALCGCRFNYEKDGTLREEPAWADLRQEHCSNITKRPIPFNPDCLAMQEQTRKARTRKPRQPKAETAASTNGHR
jgi:hypothetical protein